VIITTMNEVIYNVVLILAFISLITCCWSTILYVLIYRILDIDGETHSEPVLNRIQDFFSQFKKK